MRYLRTNGSSMLSSLNAVATSLDGCWWYLNSNGFSLTKEFVSRLRPRQWTEQQVHDHWMRLLTDYVQHDTPVGRVGTPGFFRRLGDSVDFSWACHFAIEATELPLQSLRAVERLDRMWFGPFNPLPPDVVVVARDVDSAYQEYGFRDEWMFRAVLGNLRTRGLPADEVTSWPHGP